MLTRNNVLVYLGVPTGGVGASSDVPSAAGILTRYDVVVVAQQTGANLTALQELAAVYVATRPQGRVFGYHTWIDLSTAQAALTQWQSDLGASLGGIFINGFDAASRSDQNTFIQAAHSATTPCAVAVSGSNPFKFFETLGSDPISQLGSQSTIRDLVVLDGFYVQDQNSATPAAEKPEHTMGQLDYVSRVIANGGFNTMQASPPSALNVGILGLLGAGTSNSVNATTFQLALNLANQYKLDGIGIIPFDRGASGSYFLTTTADQFQA